MRVCFQSSGVLLTSPFFFLTHTNLSVCLLASVARILQEINRQSPTSFVHLEQPCMHACSVASVMSESLQLYGLQPARVLCPWEFSRQLELLTTPSSRGPSEARDRTCVTRIPGTAGRFLTQRATCEAQNSQGRI